MATPAASSTSRIEPRTAGSRRRRATVHISVSEALSACASTSWLSNPPVPRINREANSRSAMRSGDIALITSSSLNRRYDLDPGAFWELGVVPAASRHDLAVDRHSHAPCRRGDFEQLDDVGHGGPGRELAPLAVERDQHGSVTLISTAPSP